MKRTRYNLFQFDPTNPTNPIPFYPKTNGYTKTEAEIQIKAYRKVGCFLTKKPV